MHLLCILYITKFSKHIINMQHRLQLLCYVHQSGISENEARDNG